MSLLTNPSLLLLRNEDELTADNILVINPNRDRFLTELTQLNTGSQIHCFSYNIADHQAASKQGIQSHVGHSLPELTDLDLIIYYYPKSKPEASMMLDNIRAIANEHTRLLVVGENKGGVKSVERQLKPHANACYKLDSAKHCILYEFNDLVKNQSFDISDYQSVFTVKVANVEFNAVSVPGVFNHGKLDVGTKLLLEQVTAPNSGELLDFGCGAGLIATFLAKQSPELKLNCLDVSALALYATQQTLELNGFTANLVLSDGMQQVNGKFNLIISNPPFHTGIATDYQIAEDFLQKSKSFLKPKGKLQIVANSFLKYPPILEQTFGCFETVIKNNKFAIYQAYNF